MDKRPISEISHLFLSNVRELPRPGAPRPVRVPPGGQRIQRDESIDLTPEEFAQVFGQIDLDEERPAKKPIVSAVVASHLSGVQCERVKDYARHLAVQHSCRVGLIELDASEFKLMSFHPGVDSHADESAIEADSFDARQMAEAIEEMNVDVDRWLLHVVNPRLPESRNLLRTVNHWTLLSTCDHDGVVSCYRTLKGLADLHKPRVSLALLDSADDAEATGVYRKLSGVCEQFLHWPMLHEPAVLPADTVAEALVMHCRPVHSKAQMAIAPQWDIVAQFLSNAESELYDQVVHPLVDPTEAKALHEEQIEEEMPHLKAHAVIPEPLKLQPAAPVDDDPASDVVDLPGLDASPAAIVSAVVRHDSGALVECPVRPPMCPEATLAVSRERGLVLLAVTKAGLVDLRSIAQAYQWLNHNRSLIAMAMPQFAIDAHRLPSLRLLVDHRDMSADLLQPMLEASHVTVQAYRKLRWGQKAGLLLEAA